MEASEKGHSTVVRLLVELGAEVNLPHNNGSTVLLAATQRREVKMIRLLLDLGANPDIENFDGWSARKWATSESNPALMAVFGPIAPKETSEGSQEREEEAQVVAPQRIVMNDTFWTAFMRAASVGDRNTVRRFADEGVEINGQSPNGTTALIAAVKNGQKDTVLELIELGADLNIPDQEGLTALAWAAKKGEVLLVKTLKESGAQDEDQERPEETPARAESVN